MNIYLRDKDLNDSGWAQALISIGPVLGTHQSTIELTNAPAIIFLHFEGEANRNFWIRAIADFDNVFLVLVNRGGRTIYMGTSPRVFPCWWSPTQFGQHPRPRQLCDLIRDGAPIEWSLLQPENSEAIMTARILGRAAGICSEKDSGICHEFKIHRPPTAVLAAADAVSSKAGSDQDLEAEAKRLEEALRSTDSPAN